MIALEGPRALHPTEIEPLRHLTDSVFREGMMNQYPQLFNADNYENLRVCVDNGIVASHVGMKIQEASFFGNRIKTACIGGVSTLPEYRKLGLASLCFDDARRKAREEGVDIMIVSGDRHLYRSRGCLPVGRDLTFQWSASATSAATDITLAPLQNEELSLLTECYRAEPVRYQRQPSDYNYALQSHWAMNHPIEFLTIRQKGAFRAYALVSLRRKNEGTNLVEYGGDRHALLQALPQIQQRHNLTTLSLQVARHDTLLKSLLEQSGLSGTPCTTSGTVTLINFPQIMDRLRPLFAEKLGIPTAQTLRFWEEEEQFGFALANEKLILDRDTTTRLLFGTLERTAEEIAPESGALGEVLQTILPLPTLWYGINYV